MSFHPVCFSLVSLSDLYGCGFLLVQRFFKVFFSQREAMLKSRWVDVKLSGHLTFFRITTTSALISFATYWVLGGKMFPSKTVILDFKTNLLKDRRRILRQKCYENFLGKSQKNSTWKTMCIIVLLRKRVVLSNKLAQIVRIPDKASGFDLIFLRTFWNK